MKSVAVVEPGARGALHQKLRYGESGSRSRLSCVRTLWDGVMGGTFERSLEKTMAYHDAEHPVARVEDPFSQNT